MKLFKIKPASALLSYALLSVSMTPCSANQNDNGNHGYANSQTLENANKSTVLQLSKSMLGQADEKALGRYFAKDLIQHDPALLNGRQAMLNSIHAMRQQMPARTLTVKHILADRDIVFVHSQISATPANEMSGVNRYDTYRLDDGVIVEHWVVQADAPTTSASGNSEFSDLYTYASPPAPVSQDRMEMNRLLAKSLSEDVFALRNFGVLDRLWATNYIQHNPYLINGRAALAGALPYFVPVGNLYSVTRSMSDGDLALVCAHGQAPGSNPADEFSGGAVCDLYRVVNYEMVEHWDVWQAVPATSVNGNSMFSNLYRKDR